MVFFLFQGDLKTAARLGQEPHGPVYFQHSSGEAKNVYLVGGFNPSEKY